MQHTTYIMGITTRILVECLNAQKQDKVLIISDDGTHSRLLAHSYAASAQSICAGINHIIQRPQTELVQVANEVTTALAHLPEKNIVILTVSNKLGSLGHLGKSFRRFCQMRQHRFISTTGLASLHQFDALIDAMDVNYMEMHVKGQWLKKQFDNASNVRIRTRAGTDITLDIFGMQAISNTGNYRHPGTGGNIPAGEVYMAPRGTEHVNGIVVIDGSMRTDTGGVLLDDPVTMTIKHGRVVNLEGAHAHLLDEALKRAEQRAKFPERIRVIGELGIGINPRATIVGTTIVDEKVHNTAHIAIGSNYWFGGANRTIFHGDQVFKNPKIFIDDKELIIS